VNRPLIAGVVVPTDSKGRTILIRMKRPCFNDEESYWELPGGAVEPGESAVESAKRELLEETGYICDGAELLPVDFEAVPGMGSTPHRVVFLTNCHPGEKPVIDATAEGIVECGHFSDVEIDAMIARQEIRSLVTLGAIVLDRRRRNRAL
jgi:8-oxo-dGTP pyrophosphatase MutT (NUDIX family)